MRSKKCGEGALEHSVRLSSERGLFLPQVDVIVSIFSYTILLFFFLFLVLISGFVFFPHYYYYYYYYYYYTTSVVNRTAEGVSLPAIIFALFYFPVFVPVFSRSYSYIVLTGFLIVYTHTLTNEGYDISGNSCCHPRQCSVFVVVPSCGWCACVAGSLMGNRCNHTLHRPFSSPLVLSTHTVHPPSRFLYSLFLSHPFPPGAAS
ncbi:unnamed protein product [Trypanosoma congolense IL3000]|uniref:WGS project CAEQ00000000 data, annotated contig 1531 n=1 Tax=Trypanosoma congolense (strain IL3000) TaxID=1068625 RepID=F9W6X0_TRYCI|nr:unnamed protein product [Trypanosoma congolense IL3000]